MSTVQKISLSGSDFEFDCLSTDTILRGGLRMGLGLAYECNVGACGSCKFELLEGEVEDLFPEATGIRPKEREKGKRLACQCRPLSKCKVKIRTGDEYVSKFTPQIQTAYLVKKTNITHDLVEFTLKTESSAAFINGQYAMLSSDALSPSRAYSMSNSPNEAGEWQFIIRKVPEGKFTQYLFEKANIGDSFSIDGPYGIAHIEKSSSKRIVGIAGGSGLAPVLSIMHAADESRKLFGKPILLYGARTPQDIPSHPAINFEDNPEFEFTPIVSDSNSASLSNWSGEVGFVHELISKRLDGPPTEYEYFLAGPPPMIEAVVKLLVTEKNVPSNQIHFDRFF